MAEQGPVDQVLSPPFHPRTRLLITSVPELRAGWLEDTMQTREAAAGIARAVEITDIGCPFFNRCPLAIDGVCDKDADTPGHQIACHASLDKVIDSESKPQQILHGYEKALVDEELR